MPQPQTEPQGSERAALAAKRGIGPVARKYAVGGIEVRAAAEGSTVIDFYGHASVTGAGYDMYGGPDKGGWTEYVDEGAFKKTLNERADVAFLVNHTGLTLARTKAGSLNLAEDDIGLEVKAQLDTRVSIVNDLVLLMEAKNLDEMSFAFRIVRQKWLNADGEEVPWWDMSGIERHICEVNMNKGDVSVVNYGASPFTDASLRGLPSLGDFTGAMLEVRAGATLSAATRAVLQNVLDLIAGADDNVDDAQVALSDLMGVPNPDDDDAKATEAAEMLVAQELELEARQRRTVQAAA